jgi:hypothetical protein
MSLFDYINPKIVVRGLARSIHDKLDKYAPGFHEVVRTRRRRAAVAAVATALAHRKAYPPEALAAKNENGKGMTPWQAVMRTRQLKQRGR